MTPYTLESAKSILLERGFQQAYFNKNSFSLGNFQYFLSNISFTLILNNGLPGRRVIEDETKSSFEYFVSTIPKQTKVKDYSRTYKRVERIRKYVANYSKDSIIISQYGIAKDCFLLQSDKTPSYIQSLADFKAKCIEEYNIIINAQRCGIYSKNILKKLV